ncbi:MAG: response regulator [Thermodesulfobacteriota bacterium]
MDNKLDVTVLYVEDEELARSALSGPLARRVKTLLLAKDGMEGLELFRLYQPEIVITDIRMPRMNGLEMTREIKALRKNTQLIVTTAHSDTKYFLEAIEAGVDRYVLKPIEHDKLFAALENCMIAVTLEQERQRHHEEREALIAELKAALEKVKTLSGFLPICASCKKIRDDKGYWTQIERYIQEHSEAEFTHSICPECTKRLYPELSDEEV